MYGQKLNTENDIKEQQSKIRELYNFIKKEIDNVNKEIVYFESHIKSDIVKKIFRENRSNKSINIKFWNGYQCELDVNEFNSFVNNIIIPYETYTNDIVNELKYESIGDLNGNNRDSVSSGI